MRKECEAVILAAKEWWRRLPEYENGQPSKERILSAHNLVKAVEELIKSDHASPSAEEGRRVAEYEESRKSVLGSGIALMAKMQDEQRKKNQEIYCPVAVHGRSLLTEALRMVDLTDPPTAENLESAHDLALAASQVLGLCARLAKKS